MAWYLNPALENFRSEVDATYSNRDKTSDGTIGDEQHQQGISDHNPDADGSVDAWDMDVEVNGVGKPYLDNVEYLKRIFQAHESSSYWIHNRIICSRDTGWKRFPYYGENPHDKHVHWNTRSAYENSKKPWGLVMLDGDDIAKIHNLYLGSSGPTLAQALQTTYKTLPTIKAIQSEVEALKTLISGVGTVSEDTLRRIVREEIDKTTLGA